jgi:hypothetical protein
MSEPAGSKTTERWRRPGFLLEPLGWVQDRLAKAFEAEPTLVELLFDLDQSRMHLIALALAHMNGDVTPDLALILLQESRKTILNLSVGHRPVGIGRALRRLPPKVLAAEIYRKLVDLLDDPVPAKFLHHIGSITDLLITGIHRLPAGLRTAAIMAVFNQIDGMIWFVDGLRVLASRAGLRFDTLAHQIGALDQSDQIAATIRQVVDGLPLPATLPPAEIEGFRRLDTVAEIRELAKNWRNCLAGYLFSINDGTSAIYLSEQLEAVCFLCRHGRMGWFLLQTKGPKNVAIDPDQLAQIHAAFADAGIPPSWMIEAIKSIIQTHEWPRYHPELDDDEIFADIELY